MNLDDGEWVEVSESKEIKDWKPIEKEGAVLFMQTGQGKYDKYVYENGRYNLVGEVE